MLARIPAIGGEIQGQPTNAKQAHMSGTAGSSHEATEEHSPKGGERIIGGPMAIATGGISASSRSTAKQALASHEATEEHSPKGGVRIIESAMAMATQGTRSSTRPTSQEPSL